MSDAVQRFSGYVPWHEHRTAHASALREEFIAEQHLQGVLSTEGLRGTCILCGTLQWFRAPRAPGTAPLSLRESLSCKACGANARHRSTAQVLFGSTATDRADVYMTEQTSHVFLPFRRHCRRLVGSEFIRGWRQRLRLSLWLLRHRRMEWLRSEDVTALSFPDRAFDAIVTMDVLEHVPDYRRALVEFARVLRPGGALVLTVPFYDDQAESAVLASIGSDGEVVHLQPAEYHGDPLSGSGALCFHHFGWDLLDAMRSCGFATAEAVRVRDGGHGIPQAQWVLLATR